MVRSSLKLKKKGGVKVILHKRLQFAFSFSAKMLGYESVILKIIQKEKAKSET